MFTKGAVFDFPPEFIDPEVFLRTGEGRSLYHLEVDGEVIMSPVFMTDLEVRESIVDDILAATMWEIQTSNKLDFDFSNLTSFVKLSTKERIHRQLHHPEIIGLISIVDGQLRIKKDSVILQAAMDYCGCWYNGYVIPDESIVINRIAVSNFSSEKALSELVTSIAMDLQATQPVNKSITN